MLKSGIFSAFLIGAASFTAAAFAQDQQSSVTNQPDYDAQQSAEIRPRLSARRQINFTPYTMTELQRSNMDNEEMAAITKTLKRAPGAEGRTKMWVANADICDLPGDETMIRVVGPVTCGSAGCQLIIMGESRGKRRVIARTYGDTVSSPAQGRLLMNEGSPYEAVLEFNGSKFKRMRKEKVQ